MMISDSHKFIFCHLPKTGGSSITILLSPYANCHVNKNNRIHSSMDEIYRIVGRDKFTQYFKFCSVRNPWSLTVSRYFFLKNQPNHPQHKLARSSFGSFINNFYQHQRVKEIDMLKVSEEIAVDFWIKVENFQHDFDIVCEKLNIPRQKLIQHNKTDHKYYTEYYDDKLKTIIQKEYEEYIELFKYKFEE